MIRRFRYHRVMATPSFSQLFATFGRIGILSFGGPAAQISLMHEELVERHKWLTEKQFLGALSFCMLLPGPEAMQLATYAGWRLRGVPGGLLAGALFVLPGAALILALATGYVYYGQAPVIQILFLGIQAAVVVIVLQALLKLSRKALSGPVAWALASLAFCGMFFFSLPFPMIIAAAALWGAAFDHRQTQPKEGDLRPVTHWFKTASIATTFALLWAAPLVALALSDASFLTDVGVFFSKLAVVTFGGAYAVLAYMTQAVVETHGWLTTEQMIDALGLAETTPGPLILVTQFVGHVAGFQQGGLTLSLAAGALTLYVTFVPCFLWIFTGAPYVEYLLSRPRLNGALSGISAAVVGVILNLSIWFGLHVIFGNVRDTPLGPRPDLASFDPTALALTGLAALMLLVLRLPMIPVLGLMAAGSYVASLL